MRCVRCVWRIRLAVMLVILVLLVVLRNNDTSIVPFPSQLRNSPSEMMTIAPRPSTPPPLSSPTLSSLTLS